MSCTCSSTYDIDQAAIGYGQALDRTTRRIVLCAGTGCLSAGALKVRDALVRQIADAGLPIVVELKAEDEARGIQVGLSGCQGFCQQGPLVTVLPENLLYCKVTEADVPEIVATTLVGGKPVDRLLYRDNGGQACRGPAEIPFYSQQSRIVLAQCGVIDPESLEAYCHAGGYRQARRAWRDLGDKELCDLIAASGLRGRGGGGFPTGRKWEACRIQQSAVKYIICNADEGDPGAFMNRSVMEGNPHSVLEGMMIAAKAIGATAGWVYLRAEYPLAVKRVKRAVADAEAAGLLGDDVFGTGRGFRITVMEGAGAFVCGEETALIASIEGHRGMPKPKPPFPAEKGLWNKPTVINNVETLAMVPLILDMGVEAFRARGTKGSPGTKTFALTGHVANTGLIEVPFGCTLRQIVFDIGGGVVMDGKVCGEEAFKAVQIGGPSGGCLTREHLDLKLDYDSLRGVGAMVGSGGMVVMNTKTCMVDVARFFMTFTTAESCGKCVPCREGTRQMLAMLDEVVGGRADEGTLARLADVAQTVQIASLCGLGKTAPSPVLSTMRLFKDEYLAHVVAKRCPTRTCKALSPPEIDAEICKGCGLCIKACPVGAISGERKQAHRIDYAKCISCGACITSCKFKAVA
ncbi:MAG TPA: NADH-quinone oxidoreductase subunit F [Planctomycetes bacterium]|nr:NADH-quinone oxidoreductase subunit F [Planctomycetota bacterium]